MSLVAVAVPVPFLDLLTYRVPDSMAAPVVGARVRVPVGSRVLTGVVVDLDVPPADLELKDLIELLDTVPYVPASVVALCRWTADYYLAGIGDTVAVALPPGAKGRKSGFKTRRVASITPHGLETVRLKTAGVGSGPFRANEADGEPGFTRPDGADSGPGYSRAKQADAGPGFTRANEADVGLGFSRASEADVEPGFSRAIEADVEPGFSRADKLTPKQCAALDVLVGATPGLPISELRDRGVTADMLARLAARGLVAFRDEQEDRDPFERAVMPTVTRDATRQLTVEQSTAFEQLAMLADTREFRVALLHGVTGSGKTEIYLRLADRVRRAGRQVLLMVPEIALTPSMAAQFRGAFAERVAIQHSALSDGERHDQWQRIRAGDVDIVVGTRSAVFAPLARLGLLIVDEEHDSSYKQEESPRYHGRDVAIVRASRDQALVVLGSATPSMESYQNAESAKYARAMLERRVLDRPLAAVTIVNMREEYTEEGPDVILSRALVAAIDDRLQRSEQILVLLNRRGYATAVFCRQCGDTYECPNCSVSLTVHRVGPARAAHDTGPAKAGHYRGPAKAGHHGDVGPGFSRADEGPAKAGHYTEPAKAGYDTGPAKAGYDTGPAKAGHYREPAKAGHDTGPAKAGHYTDPAKAGHLGDVGPGFSRADGVWRARCHYCNYSTKVAKQCRKCAAPYMEQAGFGTEKVEQQLRDLFPAARIGRVDRDSIRRKGALTSLLSRFAAGELDVLVGTQMIAKGHDFPRVTLVGVISADVGLGLADFRAAERTFQLLTQVAGRAGRGEQPGQAIVQTLYPEHYSIQLACRQDYPAFFERELQYRRGMRYPPMVALINTIVRGRTFEEAMATATDLVRRLEPAVATSSFAILGPAPAPLGRLRGEHRVQFFLKGTRRAEMRNALRTVLAGMPEVRRRVTVDVDPLSVL